MDVSLKYAVVERERRFLVAGVPDGVTATRDIVDRYVIGTRLRLREVGEADGTVVRKLGHKLRLGVGAAEVACTNLYLDDDEWGALVALPARLLRKRRHLVERDGVHLVVDEHEDGTLVAEIDDRDRAPVPVPDWLEVLGDVSEDETWTGAGIARLPPDPGRPTRVYVDMVGDLFHSGHVDLLRRARSHGDWLVVGVLSDETAARYKRRPVTTLAERVAVIESCRYVDEVVPDAPFEVTQEFLDEHDIARVVHGDDLTPAGVDAVYAAAARSGRLTLVPRTGEISTTALIQRVLDRAVGEPPHP